MNDYIMVIDNTYAIPVTEYSTTSLVYVPFETADEFFVFFRILYKHDVPNVMFYSGDTELANSWFVDIRDISIKECEDGTFIAKFEYSTMNNNPLTLKELFMLRAGMVLTGEV